MMRSLWISKTGLDAQQMNLDTIANNLANASTTAFKTMRPMFEDLMYQTLREPGSFTLGQATLPDGLQVGAGARLASTERINTQGALLLTANPLDVAIKGNGYFQITMPDGSLSYTRDGSFSTDQNGLIVTQAGFTVGNGISIPSGSTSLTISADGVVQYTLDDPTKIYTAGNLVVANFINPNGLLATGGNLFLESPASGTPVINVPGTNGTGVVAQKNLEQSNVNIAEQLVQMIAAQRLYEIQARAITASDQMLQKIGQL
jgi:flagellar basal-body rod protein FlgG